MRPETVHYRLNQAFDHWFETKELVVSKQLLRGMNRLWKRWAREEEDFQTGDETYKYVTPESINNNLLYVSDRWRCAFRLRWLIDGLEQNKF